MSAVRLGPVAKVMVGGGPSGRACMAARASSQVSTRSLAATIATCASGRSAARRLRSVAGDRAYSWLNKGTMDPKGIARFLILDGKFPRSLIFSYDKIMSNMSGLALE